MPITPARNRTHSDCVVVSLISQLPNQPKSPRKGFIVYFKGLQLISKVPFCYKMAELKPTIQLSRNMLRYFHVATVSPQTNSLNYTDRLSWQIAFLSVNSSMVKHLLAGSLLWTDYKMRDISYFPSIACGTFSQSKKLRRSVPTCQQFISLLKS